jgi:hypothetical protein
MTRIRSLIALINPLGWAVAVLGGVRRAGRVAAALA